MGVPNSFVDIKDDVGYVLKYMSVYYLTVGGIYKPLRENLSISNRECEQKTFSIRRQSLEDVLSFVVPWLSKCR